MARIQNAGLDINAGFIVGFDSDDKEIFEDQFRFIQENGITVAMVGMLQAIPRTPLYERLQREGRLVEEDPNCNFIPKQMTREELRQGYWDLVKRLYTPEAFLDRYFKVYSSRVSCSGAPRSAARPGKESTCRHWSTDWPCYGLCSWALCARWLAALGWESLPAVLLRPETSGTVGRRHWLAQYLNRCVTHWHFYKFTREATAGRLQTYNSG